MHIIIMDKLQIAWSALQEPATIHINSYPHFILEAFTGFIVCCIFIYLHLEITRIGKETVNLKPYTIYFKGSIRGSYSQESICTSVTRVQHEYCQYRRHFRSKNGGAYRSNASHSTHSQLKWLLNQSYLNKGDTFGPIVEERYEKQFLNARLASLTPQEFVRLDLEHNRRQREVRSALDSLSALYDTVIQNKQSERTIKDQLQHAKENLQCLRYTVPPTHLETQNLTESLFNVLEAHVINSSLEKPLPFKGDFTSMAYEIGNLMHDGYEKSDVTRESSKESISNVAVNDAVDVVVEVLNNFRS